MMWKGLCILFKSQIVSSKQGTVLLNFPRAFSYGTVYKVLVKHSIQSVKSCFEILNGTSLIGIMWDIVNFAMKNGEKE